MTDEILKRIDALAAKLSVTADHLYGVLVRQAHITAVVDVFWIVLGFIGIWGGVLWIKKAIKDFDNGEPFFWLGIGIICFGALLISINFNECVTGFMNPEYLAVDTLKSLFK